MRIEVLVKSFDDALKKADDVTTINYEEWQTLKAELAQQTHNSKSIPLLCECGCHVPDGDFHCHVDGKTYCEVCAK